MWWHWLLLGLISCSLCMPIVRRYALSHGLCDQPGERRLHKTPIARGGGASIVLIILLALVWMNGLIIQQWLVLTAFIVTAVTGWVDDHRPMQPLPKFVLLCAGAILAIVSLMPELNQWLALNTLWLLIIASMLAFVLLWLINLYNFMDGSHGLATIQVLLACLAILCFTDHDNAAIDQFVWLVVGALLAFIPWNFPRPVIFLGDVGSLSLGLLVGWLLLTYVMAGALSPWVAILIPAVFLVDATATLLLRMWQGEKWFQPHTKHAYQRLVHQGRSHTQVCIGYATCNLLLVYPAIVLLKKQPSWACAIVIICYLGLLLLWALVQFQASVVESSSST